MTSREPSEAMIEVINFLLGKGPLEGRWFGNKFWWRKHLREAIAAMQSARISTPSEDVERDLLTLNELLVEHAPLGSEPWLAFRRIEAAALNATQPTKRDEIEALPAPKIVNLLAPTKARETDLNDEILREQILADPRQPWNSETDREAYWAKWPNGDAGDAIDFACDHAKEPMFFLEDWRKDGAVEWPEYQKWLAVQRDGFRASSASQRG